MNLFRKIRQVFARKRGSAKAFFSEIDFAQAHDSGDRLDFDGMAFRGDEPWMERGQGDAAQGTSVRAGAGTPPAALVRWPRSKPALSSIPNRELGVNRVTAPSEETFLPMNGDDAGQPVAIRFRSPETGVSGRARRYKPVFEASLFAEETNEQSEAAIRLGHL